MPIEDFYECYLYDQIEPIGESRGDLQAGIIASTIANMSGRVRQLASPKDFMFFIDQKEQPTSQYQTVEQMHENFLVFKKAREAKGKLN